MEVSEYVVRKEDVMGRKIIKLEMVAALPTRTRVAAYARVSCGKDEMLHSLAAQVSYYSELIQSRPDWEYAGVYADEAQTGTKDNRAEFQRLLADCRAGKIDLVLTKSISRFARNTVTLLETVRELKDLGIDVYFEEQNIHTASADGELMLTILASYAQEESRSVSENQKWRVRKDFHEGKPTGSVRLLGYERKGSTFTVIPEEAETVRMIFSDYLSGMGKNAIMKKLTRLGIRTMNGGRWTETGVADILRNERYAGDLLLQKVLVTDHLTKHKKRNHGDLPQYFVEGHHEPIISRETFMEAQEEIARRTARTADTKASEASVFTGIIRCQRCGANFRRKINAAGTKYARATWACATFTNRGKAFCPAKRIPEDILMETCAQLLGLSVFDTEAFTKRVAEIRVSEDGVLNVGFKDGTEQTATWEHHSRRDCWTAEMREVAREAARRGHQHG